MSIDRAAETAKVDPALVGRWYSFFPEPSVVVTVLPISTYFIGLALLRIAAGRPFFQVILALVSVAMGFGITMLGSARLHIGVDGVTVVPLGYFGRRQFVDLNRIAGSMLLRIAGRPGFALVLKSSESVAIGPWQGSDLVTTPMVRRCAAASQHLTTLLAALDSPADSDDPWLEVIRPGLESQQRREALNRAWAHPDREPDGFEQLVRASIALPNTRREVLRELGALRKRRAGR